MPPQHGKLVAHSTPVLTPLGWTTHGELYPGDFVYGPDGKPTKIVGESVEGVASLEVAFTDGATIKVHPRHEWTIYDRSRGEWRTMETREMLNRKLFSGGKKKRAVLQVSENPRVEGKEAFLPLDPYVLGAWLGDGSASKACITHSPKDKGVIDCLVSRGQKVSAVCEHKGTGVLTTYFTQTMKYGLTELGLWENKHIPNKYLVASVKQRLELLAGLIDTDGYVYKETKRYCFSNVNYDLVKDTARLVRSLGWRATIARYAPSVSTSGIKGKRTVYQLTFSVDVPVPTQLDRKRLKTSNSLRRRRGIKAIRETRPEAGKCIQVAREDGLYLVGDHLIPTHNSEFTSKYFPSWFLGTFPKKKVILGSYESSYAQTWGKQSRDTLKEWGPSVFGVSVDTNTRSGHFWRTDQGGYMWSVGVGGGVTGKGADVFLIDDPVKNDQEAMSPTFREKTWNWYRATAKTRLQPGGAIIIIMTRWHEDDLAGRLLDLSRRGEIEPFEEVSFPAIAEDNDLLGRERGEALWPERYNLKWLTDTKADLGTFWWNSLYQQRPVSEEGGIFHWDWWQYFREVPHKRKLRIQSWDTAYEESDSANWTVGGTWDEYSNGYYLRDVVRKRLEYPDLKRAVIREYKKWLPDAILVEYMASGKSLVQDLKRDREIKVPIIAQQVNRASKQVRARAVSPQVEAGNVFIPESDHWVDDYLDELCRFPAAKNDDQVDMTSQALEYLAKRKGNVVSGAKILRG